MPIIVGSSSTANDLAIVNMALAHLGDIAMVTSIAPEDGSVQSHYAAIFFPQAIKEVLERHTWSFAVRREALTLSTQTPPSSWTYAYISPDNVGNYLNIYDPLSKDDESSPFPSQTDYVMTFSPGRNVYTAQPFVVETGLAGITLIYTNQENAVLRYSLLNPASTEYSPLFMGSVAWRLASYLAGPLIKGDAGAKAAASCMQSYQAYLSEAIESDSNQRRSIGRPSVPWIRNR